jgi:poly(hydroxyalkanoate) depolymerase family esterase
MLKIIFMNFFFFTNVFAQVILAPVLNNHQQSPRALVVFLHGCKMDGTEFARTTAIDEFIEKENIVALFPSQNDQYNSDHCWNWFLPLNQSRFISLEHFSILDQISRAQTKYKLKAENTFLVGLSSGGAYAMNLVSCFPEKFNGVAIHSGLSYLAATDPLYANQALIKGPQFNAEFTSKEAFRCGGKNHHQMKTILIHGKEDKRVYPINFESMRQHFIHLYDLADDEKLNQSFPKVSFQFYKQTPKSYNYSEFNFENSLHQVVLKTILIDQLEHKWSGGTEGETYADPKGPKVTKLILDYFLTEPSKRHQE